MSFSIGRKSITLEDILCTTSELDIVHYYLKITHIPIVIKSPLREDKKPSLGLYSNDGKRIHYVDFSTKERGGLYDLLSKMWNISYTDTLDKIYKDVPKFNSSAFVDTYISHNLKPLIMHSNSIDIQCKVRDWKDYDIEYWKSYGISIEWLKYAEVYPISHKIIIKDNNKYIFNADKYAYAYVEHKEGRVTLKIYQPFNKDGYKWSNKHDSSVISLWTKVPKYGNAICICSSLKDALCLWANTGIPSIAIQGEGYKISNTAMNELRRRYKYIFICLDNDISGLKDAELLSQETGFTNIILPQFNGGKDISDMFKILGKEEFIKIIKELFTSSIIIDDLPF